MENTNTHTMKISTNPILMAQVNAYISMLVNTKMDDEATILFEVVANDDRNDLVAYLREFVNFRFDGDISQRPTAWWMAKSLSNMIQMF